MAQNPKRGSTVVTVVLITMIVMMIAATGLLIYLSINLVNKEADVAPTKAATLPQASEPRPEATEAATTEPPTTEATEAPETEHVVATATVGAVGDLLMHKPVFDTCRQSDGSYDFSSIFRYCKDVISNLDYAIANLETTFGGDNYTYQGNPAFNCPDPLIDAVKDAGFDMLLTANNHAGDTMNDGIKRTIETVRNAGLATLGSQLSGENRYSVVDVNGIKIGMVCYTWAFADYGGSFSLNGLSAVKDEGQMNYFSNNNPDKLYNELGPIMEGMKADGAEVTMILLHWGQEYQLVQNAAQSKMAQKLCDMGFDVIVGGHPHVVQPMAVLEGTENPDHKAYCIYSLGNAVSNQRNGYISACPGAHGEDGLLFTVTFEKYSDGKVYVAGVDALPTWVNMQANTGKKEYNIVPLNKEQEDTWGELGMSADQVKLANQSYERTMKIIGEGLTACQEFLTQAKADREQYYLNLPDRSGWTDVMTVKGTGPEPIFDAPETTASEAA